jgi:adenine phosphoribosyltransferase
MNAQQLSELKAHIRTIPDFPSPGIQFRDMMPLLADAHGYGQAVAGLIEDLAPGSIDAVVAIEARGFLLAGGIARALGCGVVPVRKPGKLPGFTLGLNYALEYGTDRLEIQQDALKPDERVLLVDDLIATGGTAEAAARLIGQTGARLEAIRFLIDLPALGGMTRLKTQGWDCAALIAFD